MKITIDEDKCIGCGTCELTCGKCFKLEGNVAKVISQECGDCDPKQAAEGCPVGAITVK